tara:strand:- start:280 stop:1029 length:750 start_codon:yes stop_codon:yes gene_type:complete
MLNELKRIGLSDNEARVYLAMLELGPATVLEISAKAGVNRPTTYVQIEALKKEGLVSSHTKGKKQLFNPESPSQLESILGSQKKELAEKQDELKKVLGDLTSLHNLGADKPIVRYFEGKEGLLKMQDEFLKMKGKEILGIYSLDDVLKIFPNQARGYSEKRLKKKIKARGIYTYSKGAVMKEKDKSILRETRFVHPDNFSFKSDITIFDNNIAISSLSGKIGGTIITDKVVADSFRALFELLWGCVNRL